MSHKLCDISRIIDFRTNVSLSIQNQMSIQAVEWFYVASIFCVIAVNMVKGRDHQFELIRTNNFRTFCIKQTVISWFPFVRLPTTSSVKISNRVEIENSKRNEKSTGQQNETKSISKSSESLSAKKLEQYPIGWCLGFKRKNNRTRSNHWRERSADWRIFRSGLKQTPYNTYVMDHNLWCLQYTM